MPANRPLRPQMERCRTGRFSMPAGLGLALSSDEAYKPQPNEKWTVRTPQGLILADHREPHGWRVAIEEGFCQVYVPDYAPLGKNYSLCLEDESRDSRRLDFDVAD